jgi:hypothetical protein
MGEKYIGFRESNSLVLGVAGSDFGGIDIAVNRDNGSDGAQLDYHVDCVYIARVQDVFDAVKQIVHSWIQVAMSI